MGPLFDDQDITLRMGMKNREKLSKNASRQVFLQHEENALVEYLLTYSKLCYGLTMNTLRDLAYQFAVSLNRKFPDNWAENRKAGKDWAMRFLKRHRTISIRKPEDTSVVGSTVFNRTNLKSYYESLQTVMQQHNVDSSRIWKLSTVDLSTMLQATECVSKEKEDNVSIVVIVNASGDYMPPVYIFPRNETQMENIEGVPDNAITLFNENGRMNSEEFLRTLENIKDHTAPSKKHPIILLLDQASYLTIDALKMCLECGIHIVSLPPQTRHETQSLELTVSDLFKA
uniref:Uncharacterized protein n=1 Tax=Phlebotomus papatasi TaxID=29031 RepID=A0A1B0DQE4_PHLPP